MNFNQVKILFVLSKTKMNMRGMCPLICRITYNGKRKEFSTGFLVSESDWNAKLQIVTSKTTYSKNINTHLNKIYRDLLANYSEVVVDKGVFVAGNLAFAENDVAKILLKLEIDDKQKEN